MSWHGLLHCFYWALAILGLWFIASFEHRQRMSLLDRARRALAEDAPTSKLPHHPRPWTGWVDIRGDGTVAVAGRCFDSRNAFAEIIARDKRNIARARVEGLGQGEVRIASHGQTWIARFEATKWEVMLLEDENL